MATHATARISGYRDGVLSVGLYILDCADCGVVFAITRDYEERRRDDGAKFYCPNGHVNQWYESEADRAKKRAAELEKRLARTEEDRSRYQEWLRTEREAHKATERSLSATKGVVTRTKRRIGKGVCPCCNRHFTNVERHMTTQHPGYAAPAVSPDATKDV